MKKLLTALVLIGTMMLTLTGCFQPPQAQKVEQKPEEKQEVKEETVTPPAETASAENVYKNTKYGYAFIIPDAWGKVTPKEEGSNNLIFTSEDGKKTLKLYNVAIGTTNDAPIKLMMVTEKSYEVYRDTYEPEINILEGQGKDVSEQKALEAELKAIELTFYLIDDKGNKIEEGGGGVAGVCSTKQLVDGSCEPTDALVYNNEENPVTFKYPKGWVVTKEETVTQGNKAVLVVNFENSNNKEATVEFRKYLIETARSMNYELDKTVNHETPNYKIVMKYLIGDDTITTKATDTLLTPVDAKNDTAPEFYLVAPSENFDEYNKFVILAASTMK